MKRRALPLSALALLICAGCVVGPNYRAPDIPTPASWTSLSEPESRPDVASRPTSRPADVAQWWARFQDPVLTDLIRRGASGNLGVAQAAMRIKAARAARTIAASGWYPQIDAGGSAARNLASGAPSSQGFFRAGFDAIWEIDVFGGTQRGVEAAAADLESARFDRETTLVSLAGEIASLYVQLRGSQRQLAIARKNLAAQQQTLDLTQERLDAGFVSALDVANARAQVATTGSQIPAFQADVQNAIYALSVLLGLEPGALTAELIPEAPLPALPAEIPVGMPSDLLLRRPDLRRAEADLHAATARVGVAIANQFPRFTIASGLGTSGGEIGSLGSLADRFWSIGPSFSVPVYTGGLVQAQIAQARAVACAAFLDYKQSVLTALQDVETAIESFTREQERRTRIEEAVVANREAVDLSLQQYGAGTTDFLNVLNSQRALYVTEASLVQSETSIAINLIALYKALGGGWSGVPGCP